MLANSALKTRDVLGVKDRLKLGIKNLIQVPIIIYVPLIKHSLGGGIFVQGCCNDKIYGFFYIK